MYRNPPKLRQHVTGVYFCYWNGQEHYFTVDLAESQAMHLASIEEWARWRADRDQQIEAARPRATDLTVFELAELFMAQKEIEGGKARKRYYKNHLARFVGAYRTVRAREIRPIHLNGLKLDMMAARWTAAEIKERRKKHKKVPKDARPGDLKFSPRNIQHDISAVRSLFTWGSGLELIPAVNLDVVTSPEQDPMLAKAYEPEQVWGFIHAMPEHVGNWLALQYLTLMRPSEVPRLVAREGEWERPWLFRFGKSKISWRTKEPRRVVLSDAALSFLRACEPRWSRVDTYYQAVYREVAGTDYEGYYPHPLRHSAATHLGLEGVDRRDIDLLLGHLPGRVSLIYNPVNWADLRRHVVRIAECSWPRRS
jgi:integrase